MARTALLFLDTETTGLRPDIHTPWEIAWIGAVHDTEAGTLAEVVRRQVYVELSEAQKANADPFALKVGRFEERYVETDSVVYTDVLDQLRYDISTTQAWAAEMDARGDLSTLPPIHLVGAIPSFDHAMICQNWTGWPGFGEGLWHYHLIDIEALAVGAINGYLATTNQWVWPIQSGALSTWFEVSIDESVKHTAMGDALGVQALYREIYDLDQTVAEG